MRHDEYERRKRALETQLREDVELLQAGYQAKLEGPRDGLDDVPRGKSPGPAVRARRFRDTPAERDTPSD